MIEYTGILKDYENDVFERFIVKDGRTLAYLSNVSYFVLEHDSTILYNACKDKLTIVSLPDVYTGDTGYMAFYGNYPINSRNTKAYVGSDQRIGHCTFINQYACIANALFFIMDHLELTSNLQLKG